MSEQDECLVIIVKSVSIFQISLRESYHYGEVQNNEQKFFYGV